MPNGRIVIKELIRLVGARRLDSCQRFQNVAGTPRAALPLLAGVFPVGENFKFQHGRIGRTKLAVRLLVGCPKSHRIPQLFPQFVLQKVGLGAAIKRKVACLLEHS